MERNYDEVIADMLIQLDQIERSAKGTARQLEKLDKRMDLAIRRMVKAESRLEGHEKRMEVFDRKLEQSIKDQGRKMEVFDRRLEQSIKDQLAFSRMQSKMNQYFLSVIKKNGHK